MSKPIAVCISDVHYNLTNLKLSDAAVRQAIKKAEQLKVPLIVAGDLHDTKASLRSECVKVMIDTFKSALCRVLVIPGNHCLVNARSSEHALEFLRPYVTEIIDQPKYDESLDLWFIPYQNETEDFYNIIKHIPRGSLVIAHQGVQGAFIGDYVIDKSSVSPSRLSDYRIITGHYHRRQTVGTVSYIGSPFTMSFGEANDPEKGFQVLNDDGSLTFVPTNFRRHIIFNIDLKEGVRNAHISKDDIVWVKIHGNKNELEKVSKDGLGQLLMGHCNYKLELIPTDSPQPVKNEENLTYNQLLDAMIDASTESVEDKIAMKSLWKELV